MHNSHFPRSEQMPFFNILISGELLQPVRGRDQQRRGGGGGRSEAGGVERSLHQAGGVSESQIMGTHRVHIFTRDETGSVYLPTQLERTLQLYW